MTPVSTLCPDAARYRADIDGLRAIAVLSVLFCHAGLGGFSGGFVGVDVFFVISGYLITGIVWRDLNARRFSPADFYARRIKRIFPALFGTLAASSIAAYFLLIPTEAIEFGKSLDASVLFYSNFHFLKGSGYFEGPSIEKPLLHLWSLAVEEQFYAAWPLLLAAMFWVLPKKRVLPAVAVLAAVSLTLAQLKLTDHAKDAFYLPYYRGWELLTGAALALAPEFALSRRLSGLASSAGCLAILLAVSTYGAATPFPGVTALVPCAGAALVIGAGRSPNSVSSALGLGPLRYIGSISYSLYLVHWPLFSFAHLFVYDNLSLNLRLGLVGVSFALAHLSFKYIETPFRMPFSHRRVFIRAASAAAGLCCAGIAFIVSPASEVPEATLDLGRYCQPVKAEGVRGGTVCSIGDRKQGDYDFLLWGDSHAAHYAPALDTIGKANHVSGIVFSLEGCAPFIDGTLSKPGCNAFNSAVADWLSHRRTLHDAFLAGRWTTYRRDMLYAMQHPGSDPDAGALSKTLSVLGKYKISPLILGQVPAFQQNVPMCLQHAARSGQDGRRCVEQPAAWFRESYSAVDGYFLWLHEHYSFAMFSPLPAFCDNDRCHAVRGDAILMRDADHLSDAGARYLIPYLQPAVFQKRQIAISGATKIP